MVDKLRALLKKHGDVLSYLFFGILTTGVNYLVCLPLYYFLHMPASASNAIAWIVAVAFAFLTNKPFVYKSYDWSAKVVWPELRSFVGCRVFSGLLETALLALTVDYWCWNAVVMKVITSAFVVILNYISGKWLVFRKAGRQDNS